MDSGRQWELFTRLVTTHGEGKRVRSAFEGLVNMEERFGSRGLPLYILLLKYAILDYIEDDSGLDTRALFGVGGGAPVRPEIHSVVGLERLTNVSSAVSTILAEDIPGDLVEAGVWRGGVLVLMAGILEAHGTEGRRVVGADSFEGLPPPSHPLDSDRFPPGSFAVQMEDVEATLEVFGLRDRVDLLKGWFADTLVPSVAGIEAVSLLRLDGDLYASTYDVLDLLYPLVSPGGFIIVDDYGVLDACRTAVDDYRTKHGIVDPLIWIDLSGVYWRKR